MKDIASDAIDYIFSSKTLAFIIFMTLMLILAFALAALAANLLKWESPVTSGELIDVWKWATGAGTARNVINDGVMPRVPQVVGAVRDPSVANQPVQPMLDLSTPKKTEQYIPPAPAKVEESND